MENKEKANAYNELTKEKSGGSAGMIQDMSINGIKLHRSERNRRARSSSGACIHISRTK